VYSDDCIDGRCPDCRGSNYDDTDCGDTGYDTDLGFGGYSDDEERPEGMDD
jgi:hypothetical protein